MRKLIVAASGANARPAGSRVTAISRKGAAILASLILFFAGTSPALARSNCQYWDFRNETFNVNQSNGYVVRITLGPPTYEGGTIRFGANGHVNIVGQGGVGAFSVPPGFSRGTGNIGFIIDWKPPANRPNDVNRGTYVAAPTNIRPTPDGGLIADLAGHTSGFAITEKTLLEKILQPGLERVPGSERVLGNLDAPEIVGASWSTPARIFCRPEDVSIDGRPSEHEARIRGGAGTPSPIKSSGHMANGPSTATTMAFAGMWQTVTSTGGHFAITFTPINTLIMPGLPIHFVGTFVNTDGAHDYDGTLQGDAVFPGNRLNYTYSQPGIQAAGTGFFDLSQDGKSISGAGIHMGKDRFDWKGTRK